MNDRVFIDTNILLYARGGGQPGMEVDGMLLLNPFASDAPQPDQI